MIVCWGGGGYNGWGGGWCATNAQMNETRT